MVCLCEGPLVRPPLELLESLVTRGYLPASRAKDIKTALQKLADAYAIDLDDLDVASIEPTALETVRAYLLTLQPAPSPYTQRNTRQNLTQFYRLLHEQHLIPAFKPASVKRMTARQARVEARHSSPYLSRSRGVLSSYGIRHDQWPMPIRAPWENYLAERAVDIRATTIEMYRQQMTAYVSYGLAIDQPQVTTWDDLFDRRRLLRFIAWHAKRVGASRVTTRGTHLARLLTSIAFYQHRPDADELYAVVKKLPAVKAFHDKQAACHAVTAEDLEKVGLDLLAEAHRPLPPVGQKRLFSDRHHGVMRATAHQSALIIRLLCRLPLRSRSIREMELDKNLFRNASGVWTLRYVGDELKVGERNGRVNVFEVPWPPELTAHLEEYLKDFRPRFPHAADNPHVFLTRFGNTFAPQTLYRRLAEDFYIRLQKRFFPHLVRTLWVDRWLISGGDVSTAAYILNDSVQTVWKRYHELRGMDHIQKAYAFNQAILGHGPGISPTPHY
jgi:integrase